MTNPNHTDTSRSDDHNGPEQTFRDTERNLRDRIEALEARVAELEDIAGDLLTRFDPWSPHDHDAAKRARAALEARHD